jgi:ABC-2 type transport system ATP-binding protein
VPVETIIQLERVSKRFGSTRAVSEVSFDVLRGRCLGWLGPNGSGKTTLIRCMLGLARVSEGTIHVRGHRIPEERRLALERVGGMVEEPQFYPYLSGRRNLQVWASFYGGEAHDRVDWALNRVALTARAKSPVKQYSQGMRQRLGLARALLNDPELLILDEPSNGLDPAGMAELRDMIRSFVDEEGRTVFVSSHLLDEVQKTADDIAIVNGGRLVTHGSVGDLVAGGRRRIRLRVDDPARAGAILEALPQVVAVERAAEGELRLELDRVDDARAIELARALVEAGVGLAELVQERESLEKRFLDITAGSVPGAPEEPADNEPEGQET